METEVKDVSVKQMLQGVYAADFNDHCPLKKGEDITEISEEDRNFMTLMEKECSKEGKHYKLCLPLRVHDEMFPDNRTMAEARLKNLKERFSSDKQYHDDYTKLKGKIWVVFDCSVEYKGVSINKKFMPGPDLTNQIISILVKFRKDFVAIMADIEPMFYQVFVADQHRNLLSFLWWENGGINEQPQHYHMNIHVFGKLDCQVVVTTHCKEQQEIMNQSMAEK